MGVECSAYTYIGVYVNSTDDVEPYLIDKGLLKEGELDEKYGGDKGGMHDMGFPLSVQSVSYYSDQGAYIGFDVEPSNYKDFDGLIAEFKRLTGDDAEVETFEQWH